MRSLESERVQLQEFKNEKRMLEDELKEREAEHQFLEDELKQLRIEVDKLKSPQVSFLNDASLTLEKSATLENAKVLILLIYMFCR